MYVCVSVHVCLCGHVSACVCVCPSVRVVCLCVRVWTGVKKCISVFVWRYVSVLLCMGRGVLRYYFGIYCVHLHPSLPVDIFVNETVR